MWGLLGRRRLPAGQAMHLRPCPAIHTMCMRFPIDVFFLDREMRVVRVIRSMAPFRTAVGGRAAHSAVEMMSGWFPENALHEGDVVDLVLLR